MWPNKEVEFGDVAITLGIRNGQDLLNETKRELWQLPITVNTGSIAQGFWKQIRQAIITMKPS